MKKRKELIDLTHEINSSLPTWAGECGFQSEIVLDYAQGFRVLRYDLLASVGTHIDLPSHILDKDRSYA